MPIELNHLDSDFCWCDPIVEVDENGVALCISRFDENRIAFYITKLAQLLSERVEARRYGRGRGDDQCSDPGDFLRLLCLGHDCNSKQYHRKQD
jgi:hypothetical protein